MVTRAAGRNFFRHEMMKFSLYIFFPIGVLYLYNEPELLDKYWKIPGRDVQPIRSPEDQLFRIPKDVKGEVERMKRLHAEKQQAEGQQS
ncbi:hypothetical protein HK097_006360 [Rhizophlyctis rosea]|uniref:Uncharacterized protein n=1 Tax=Rhizophlyctis rosea TaxID=64517 RepID=A0AAD5SND8_9FUNG|nr:hypothetical protein HK097_006360 [Rhizophlyctis rosea]